MRSIVALLALACFCNAKPMLKASFGVDNQIIGGTNAEEGKWVWQLSQERLSGTTWSHSCGASLLSGTKALGAAHCVNGASYTNIRVVAGLYQRGDTGISAYLTGFTMHYAYDTGPETYNNDIAIMTLSESIGEIAGLIGYGTLPPDNTDQMAGRTCTITGWGRTSSSSQLPNTLQQAYTTVITTDECNSLMSSVSGVNVWDGQICMYTSGQTVALCNGDDGGPLNCPNGAGGFYVAGVASWGVKDASENCMPSYPSVYTRTSYYLDWIAENL